MIKTKIAVIISIAIIWASMNFVTAIPKMHAGGLMSLAVFSSQDIDEFNSDLTKVCSDETKLNSDADEYQGITLGFDGAKYAAGAREPEPSIALGSKGITLGCKGITLKRIDRLKLFCKVVAKG